MLINVDFTGKSPNRLLYFPHNFSIASAQLFYMFRTTFLYFPHNFYYPLFSVFFSLSDFLFCFVCSWDPFS